MKITKVITQTILGILIVDLTLVMILMIGVGLGEPVQHIPFWDSQVRTVVAIIS